MTDDARPADLDRLLTLDTPRGATRLSYRQAILLADRLTQAGDTPGSAAIVAQLEQCFPADSIPAVLKLHNLILERQHAPAVELARALAVRCENNPTAVALCIRALRQAGEIAPALELANHGVARFAQLAVVHHELGLCRLSAGDKSGAVTAFNQSIRLEPRFVQAYWSRAPLVAGELEAKPRRQLAALAEQPDLSDEDRATLLFSLAWTCADSDPDRHFALLDRANALMAALRPWDETGQAEKLARTKARFTTGRVRQPARRPTAGAEPIFIVGMPRSGTSLVEQILSAHAQVTACGETGGLEKALRETAAAANLADDVSTWPADEQTQRRYAEVDARYRRHLAFFAVDTPWFTEKGLATDWLLGMLLDRYPGARVVHCRRHPLDICLSLYRLMFTSGQAFSYRLDWSARACRIHTALMDHWKSLYPERIHELHYEQLIADQRGVTADLLTFCGLDWQDDCLDFHRQSRTARTASDHQIKQPLFTAAVGRWKPYAEHLRAAADILNRDPE